MSRKLSKYNKYVIGGGGEFLKKNTNSCLYLSFVDLQGLNYRKISIENR